MDEHTKAGDSVTSLIGKSGVYYESIPGKSEQADKVKKYSTDYIIQYKGQKRT